MRDFAQQLSPRWTGFVSEKRFFRGNFQKKRFRHPTSYETVALPAELRRRGAAKITFSDCAGKREWTESVKSKSSGEKWTDHSARKSFLIRCQFKVQLLEIPPILSNRSTNES